MELMWGNSVQNFSGLVLGAELVVAVSVGELAVMGAAVQVD